ncbi:MAG: hypothetical protein GY832_12635 [Chloroflexi bacterium]|nr:hypothetical protein [Chloroflexota bacterium]
MKTRASRFTHYAPRLLLLTILLLAAFLRFYRLDAQSFWNDEGNSARIAERTPDLILEGAAGDIHPPGYYLLLHYWRALFGQSEFALRALSAVAGLVLVVFTYLLGRRLFGETVGLTAAFLGALSPFAIYYAQETRMYALLGAISAASTFLFLRFLFDVEEPPGAEPFDKLRTSPPGSKRNPAPQALYSLRRRGRMLHPKLLAGWFSTRRDFLAYILTSGAGLYVQYAFPFVLLVHNVVFSLWWLATARRSTNRWRWLARWAVAQIAIVVLYLPWLPTAIKSVTGWSSAGWAYDLGPALLNVLRVLSVGITLPVEDATLALVGAGALVLVGLVTMLFPRTDRTGRWHVASMAIYLLLPITLIFGFDLYKSTWLKFLIVVLPPFHLLIALGIKNLTQLVTRNLQLAIRLLLFVSCVLLVIPSLRNLYFNPAYARDDYRQIAADVASLVHSGDAPRRTDAAHRNDAIILNAPNQWEVFTYYYPDQDVYPAPYRPRPGKAAEFLSPLIERYRRLFMLYWGDAESDPQRLIETQLADWAYKANDHWYGPVRLATYGVGALPEEPSVALDARFGEAIRLNGHALAGERFAPGDILPVTLFWEAQTPITERYKVTVQLLDGAGQLVAQHDAEPGDGIKPTTVWEPGQGLIDRYGISLPPDLPPGRYPLIIGLYHVVTGERLAVTLDGEPIGDHLVLFDVDIIPSQ